MNQKRKNRYHKLIVSGLLILSLLLGSVGVFADTENAGSAAENKSAVETPNPVGTTDNAKARDAAPAETKKPQSDEKKEANVPSLDSDSGDSGKTEEPEDPEKPTPKLGWVTENGKTYYYDSEDHYVTGLRTIQGKKYYFTNEGVLSTGIIKVDSAYYYADGKGVIRTAKGFVNSKGNLYYVQNGGKLLTGHTFKLNKKTYRAAGNGIIKRGVYKWGKYYYYSDSKGILRTKKGRMRWNGDTYYVKKGGKLQTSKMVKSGKYYYYFGKDARAKRSPFKYRSTTIKPNKKTGAITKKQYKRASYGPYNYKRYVLVDISSQNVKYYVKGKVKFSSPVVTGGPGNRTPTGRFRLHSKSRNTTLSGTGYSTRVGYWMPFIGQSYGLHDATWRSQFGGAIYKYNGSHGCVNMPRGKAAKLYKMVPNGTRVIVRK